MNIDDLTIGQLKEINSMISSTGSESFLRPGMKVFIRTVTHHYTGQIEAINATEIQLSSAAWIPDDGRFAQAVESGAFEEIEPYPDNAYPIINRNSVLDVVEVQFSLPRKQK